MFKWSKGYFVVFVVLVVLLLGGTVGTGFVFARGAAKASTSATATDEVINLPVSAKPISERVVAMHTVDETRVPKAPGHPGSTHPKVIPFRTLVSPAVYAQRKAAAAHNRNAPTPDLSFVHTNELTASPNTPTASTRFQGMSASNCFGCEPPDMALAASPGFVMQGVNTSFAVYNTSGTLQAGWPKNAPSFFGVPNPPNNCDPSGPFMSDPRAFYDSNDGRFWVAMLQVEGALGVAPNCPFQTVYWIAVSQTNNPNGSWNIRAFDMSFGTTNAADYTQFGFDRQAIYFSGNMFDSTGSYAYAEIAAVNKALMESGASVTAHGFSGLTAGGVLVDTVQPVEVEAHTYSGPNVGLFINSFDGNGDPFGDNCSSTACKGLVVWAMANPNSSSPSLSGVVFKPVSSNTYVLPPNSDEPGCSQCVDTNDTRISGTPVFHNGLISFAINTGANNGTQIVPSIYWAQVSPIVNDAGVLTGVNLVQSRYLAFNGDTSASFGALMPDDDGNVFIVFDLMSSSINPEVVYAARRVTYTPAFDGTFLLRKGDAATSNSRWGDYEATSYDGFGTDNVWFSAQYADSNGDWSTFIGKDQYTTTSP